ncbi:MAG TPA: hypothetical protein VGL05_07200 [Kribbella sp.]
MDDAAIDALAALGDESRRRMFAFARRAGRPISRDDAATEVGISRKLAAFHLERLVEAGLLRSHFEHGGRLRKVGRAPKLYEPVNADLKVSIPPRQPDLLAAILLDGVLSAGPGSPLDSARRAAFRRGERVGEEVRTQARPGRLSAERALTLSEATLSGAGFEPVRPRPGCLRLHSCPFHPLATAQPEAVCGINHAFVAGMLSGLEATTVEAVLDPDGGDCCVEITADGTTSS